MNNIVIVMSFLFIESNEIINKSHDKTDIPQSALFNFKGNLLKTVLILLIWPIHVYATGSLGPLAVQTLPPLTGSVSVSRVLTQGVSFARFPSRPLLGTLGSRRLITDRLLAKKIKLHFCGFSRTHERLPIRGEKEFLHTH